MAFKCLKCPELQPFPSEEALKEHKLTHQYAFYCSKPWCTYNATTASQCDIHVLKCEFTDAPIVCSITDGLKPCTKTYSGKRAVENYRRHLKDAHLKSADEATGIIAADRPKIVAPKLHTPLAIQIFKRPKLEEKKLSVFQIPEPTTTTDRKILKYGQLTILYGYGIRGPRTAHIRLTKAHLQPMVKIKMGKIANIELEVPEGHRALPSDFAAGAQIQKIEKGHIISKFNLGIDEATFKGAVMMSVFIPQFRHFNSRVGTWGLLEEYERSLLEDGEFDAIDSFAGGVYSKDIGKCGRLPIATHFWKMMICHTSGGDIDVEIFIPEHKKYAIGTGLESFHKSYQELLKMDSEGFIPSFDLKNIRRFNRKPVDESQILYKDAATMTDSIE